MGGAEYRLFLSIIGPAVALLLLTVEPGKKASVHVEIW